MDGWHYFAYENYTRIAQDFSKLIFVAVGLIGSECFWVVTNHVCGRTRVCF